jgi:hypothetical protein
MGSQQNIHALGIELASHLAFNAAIEIFTYGASKYPESTRWQLGLGVSKYGNNDFAGAATVFSRLLARNLDAALYADFLGRSCSLTASERDLGCDRLTDFDKRHLQNASAACYPAGILHRPAQAQQLELARHLLQQAVAVLAPILRHPRRRVLRQFLCVFLQFGEVVERVGAVQLAGAFLKRGDVYHASMVTTDNTT